MYLKKNLIVAIFALLISACSTTRAPSLNMLEHRADYEGEHHIDGTVSDFESTLLVPNRTRPRITDIWIHPHEMPTGDYFLGGQIRTLVSTSQWQVERKEVVKLEQGASEGEVPPAKSKKVVAPKMAPKVSPKTTTGPKHEKHMRMSNDAK